MHTPPIANMPPCFDQCMFPSPPEMYIYLFNYCMSQDLAQLRLEVEQLRKEKTGLLREVENQKLIVSSTVMEIQSLKL